ncbi:hypothetical protein MBLNU230_g0444t1 [Neophaeotheca triangularis]
MFALQLASLLALISFCLAQNTTAIPYSVQQPPLDTPWTYSVGTNPWPEYPRPQLQRSKWQSLNGIWTYQNASSLDSAPPFGQTLANEVLVPSCLESGLSGIQGRDTTFSWFAREFEVPGEWAGDAVLLNFAAVDYEATVYLDGQQVAFHRGGYFAFVVDITDYVSAGGSHELLVFVHDPTDTDEYVIPIGKQTRNPSHIFYTPCSGIWQQVWIEAAPANHITEIDVSADMNGRVNVTVSSCNDTASEVSMEVYDQDGHSVSTQTFAANAAFSFAVDSPKLWSPDSPTLYNVSISLGGDTVDSYLGFRTISRGVIDGVERPLLNGEFVFQFATLDQGFWPDGIYTPPNREAMVYDLQSLKELGFNTVRKHIKVETSLFYQACDQLGLMVVQDMPSLKADAIPDAEQQDEFQRQLTLLINQRKFFPSIITWVIYNEGWGQITEDYYPEFGLTYLVNQLDGGTRLIDAVSGWDDHGAGDYHDNHHYANPQCGSPFYSTPSTPYDPTRIGFQGEFGGIGNNVSIEHLWNVQAAIDTINQTYEINTSLDAYNYRAHVLLSELTEQIEMFACSGAVWTQTTDVEGEVNGLLTYDRRILRPDVDAWQADIQGLYDAAARRSNGSMTVGRACEAAMGS